MGHLVEAHRRFEATPPEWLPIGSQFNELVNTFAERGDIITFIGEGATAGMAVACFVPSLGEMEIDVKRAFGEGFNPEFLPNFSQRRTHFDYPHIIGAILHEAGHARHTAWLLKAAESEVEIDKKIFSLVEWFEETRIERLMLRHFPENRSFLRSMALKFSLDEVLEATPELMAVQGAMGVSKIALLSLARWDAGTLKFEDIEKLWELIEAFFGEELLGKLREVWRKAQYWNRDDDISGLVALAEEWIKLLEEAGHKTEPEKLTPEQMEALGKILGEMMDAFGEAADEAAEAGADEAVDQMVLEIREKEAEIERQKHEERESFKDAADRVFSRNSGPPQKGTRSRLVNKREPTPEEVAASIVIAESLQEARYRDRVVEKRRSQLPPGRLNGRAAMQRQVQLTLGQMPDAEPWTRKIRHQTDDPKLRVAMLCDISSSMKPAMEAMSVSTWLMSEACRRIGAEVTTLYYGNSVFPVLKPGEYLEEINVYSAADGTEEFDRAFRAVNGEIDLLESSGARLLVVASDMCYRGEIRPTVTKWLKRCDEAGVATMSFPITTRTTVDVLTAGTNCRVVMGTDPVGFAMEIGQAAAEALRNAGH